MCGERPCEASKMFPLKMTDMPTRTDDLLGAAKEFLEQYYASIKR